MKEPAQTARGERSLLLSLRTLLLKQELFTSKILPALPRPLRWGLHKLYFLPLDAIDSLRGREDLVPPKSIDFSGAAGAFTDFGRISLARLIEIAGLSPRSKLLDVGSGVGRLAVPLGEYLEGGSYEGVDIVRSASEWCSANITARYPNVRFTFADVYNKEYNPRGKVQASEYIFPYPDSTFDLCVLMSVFTHMLPQDMQHYIDEISRVLRVGGRCFATYFLINDESRYLMDSSQSPLRFTYNRGVYWTVSNRTPELSIGYDESYARRVFEDSGFSTKIYCGGWCGRPPIFAKEFGLGDQDIVLATKQS